MAEILEHGSLQIRVQGLDEIPLICTDGHLYGHQTVHGFEFTNEFSGSIPATSTTNTFQNFSYGHGKFTSLADGDGLLNLSLTPNY